MSVDTTVLDTSLAVTPDLAWSLAGEDSVLEFPADRLEPDDDEQTPDERYSWWLAWRNAVLLVVVAAALAVLAAVLTSMREDHESAAAAALPAAPAVQDPSFDPVVCLYIKAGHTPQQAVESAQQNSSLTLAEARKYVAVAMAAYCPAAEGLAGAGI